MNIFEEWEGRDPLDFTNKSKKSRQKQKNSKPQKPFHKTPAGSAFGCVCWIFIIALVWNYFGKSDSKPVTTTNQVANELSASQCNYRTITPEEKKFIGQHARNVWALHKQYLALKHSPEFQKERVYNKQYHVWQDKVKDDLGELNHYLFGSNLKEYDDVRIAYCELIGVSGHFALCYKDYYTKEKEAFGIIERNCKPYQEWRGSPDLSKILRFATLDWSKCPESDKKQIGEFARYLNQQKNLYLTLIHQPDFIQNGFEVQYETWNSAILEEHDKRLENVSVENLDYYLDVDCASFELVDTIVRTNSGRRKSDFKEKTQKFVHQLDERLTPYLEW